MLIYEVFSSKTNNVETHKSNINMIPTFMVFEVTEAHIYEIHTY